MLRRTCTPAGGGIHQADVQMDARVFRGVDPRAVLASGSRANGFDSTALPDGWNSPVLDQIPSATAARSHGSVPFKRALDVMVALLLLIFLCAGNARHRLCNQADVTRLAAANLARGYLARINVYADVMDVEALAGWSPDASTMLDEECWGNGRQTRCQVSRRNMSGEGVSSRGTDSATRGGLPEGLVPHERT